MKSCLSHQRQKSDGLKRYGFTAGVRSGHDQLAEVIAEPHIDRNYFFCIQQRMTSLADINTSFFIEDRRDTVVGFGKLRLGKDEIKFGKNGVILTDSICILGNPV